MNEPLTVPDMNIIRLMKLSLASIARNSQESQQ